MSDSIARAQYGAVSASHHDARFESSIPEPTVSVRVVQGLIGAVERGGITKSELLSAVGMNSEQLQGSDVRLPLSAIYRICEVACDLTQDPALGLHWAERLIGNTFVPISYLIAQSASLRHAFLALAQFGGLLSDWLGYELVERGDAALLCCLRTGLESPRVERFSAEMVLASFFRIIRTSAAGGQPFGVHFRYPRPSYHHEYERIFAGAQQFEQPFTGLEFARALLDAPLPQRDPDVRAALEEVAQQRLSRLPSRTSFAVRVRDLLVEQGWCTRAPMRAVARALGLSERSLRRRLGSEGTSYSDTENAAFAILAKRLLHDPQCTIERAAAEMGFADASAFYRKFKRSTGTTPRVYRATLHRRESRT